MNDTSPFVFDVSRQVWESKYRYQGVDHSIADSWQRVARAVAGVETERRGQWEERFRQLLEDFRFLPGGRILAGAGTRHKVTLFNCFVMGTIEDSMDGIFDALKEGALTMQQGGGVGYDFSTLRPSGTPACQAGTLASGPVSFMRIWDAMCATLLSTGARRGAMMATLRCDHPDIEQFIDAKRPPGELRHFNLSVLLSDAFMTAVEKDQQWPLLFPLQSLQGNDGEIIERVWSGNPQPIPCRVIRRIPARKLWQKLMHASYDHAEPGVLFIDRLNRLDNLGYRESISAANPCGEIPLPPYGACNLGSINLTRFVHHPFSAQAAVDLGAIEAAVSDAVRFLDNVVDLSRFPLAAQQEQALGSRRIGLGLTGLADTLILLGLRYDSNEGAAKAAELMRTICHSAYRASIGLAREKGPFPWFDRQQYLARPFIRSLPRGLRLDIERYGIRNSHLTAIAPAGTISLLANNVSSGIEPVFSYRQKRRILQPDGGYREYELEDYAHHLYRFRHPAKSLPASFVSVEALEPRHHLQMQAALQPHVDNAISKTINIPADYPFERFQILYLDAYRLGLKGCTTFRPNPVTGAILSTTQEQDRHCCSLEREAD